MLTASDFQYLSTRGLFRRGWTRDLIQEHLRTPDATSSTGSNEARLYLRSKVLAAEQRPEVAGQLLSFWSYQQRQAAARVKYFRDQLWRDKRKPVTP